MTQEIKIRDLPDFEASGTLTVEDFFYLIKDNTFLDKKLKIGDLYNYVLGRVQNESLNTTVDNRIDVYASARSLNKNAIINGDFRFWQRGNSFVLNPNDGRYICDRFLSAVVGTGGSCTISRASFTPGELEGPGLNSPYYFNRNQSVGATGQTVGEISQRIEDVRTYANNQVTVSFYARSNAGTPQIQSYLEQNFGTGGSTSVASSISNFTLTNTWARYSYTLTLPSIVGKTIGTNSNIFFRIIFPFNTAHNIDIAYTQIELGSKATAYEFRNDQIELALCQRYYEKSYGIGVAPATIINNGGEYEIPGVAYTGAEFNSRAYKVIKRVNPTIVIYNPNTGDANGLRNLSTGGNYVVFPSSTFSNEKGFTVTYLASNNGGSNFPAGNVAHYHWTADAEF